LVAVSITNIAGKNIQVSQNSRAISIKENRRLKACNVQFFRGTAVEPRNTKFGLIVNGSGRITYSPNN
jgi:hypothetical protein